MHQYFWNFQKREAAQGAVLIEVNAHQWSWDARYPGADGRFGTRNDVITTDDIRDPRRSPRWSSNSPLRT